MQAAGSSVRHGCVNMHWPVAPDRAVLSDKDRDAPTAAEAEEAGDVFA